MHPRFPIPSTRRFTKRPTLTIVLLLLVSCFFVILFLYPLIINDKKEDTETKPTTKPEELIVNPTQTLTDDTKPLDNENQVQKKPTDPREEEIKFRRESIRNAFRFAYGGYESKCLGKGEELKPVSGECYDWLIKGMELTLFDCIDTMLIMNETETYIRTRDYLYKKIDWSRKIYVNLFETTIRYLGGLLSAYDITRDEYYLKKSKELADRLLPAFNTPTGIPRTSVDLLNGTATNPSWSGYCSMLSEVGSLQIEFSYLSYHLNDPIYAKKAMAVYDKIIEIMPEDKLIPSYINPDDATFSHMKLVTVGGLSDSFYEYLLKYWLVTKKTSKFGELYFQIIEAVINRLSFHFTDEDGEELWYFAELTGGNVAHNFEHLACFIGGTLALGAQHTTDPDVKEKHMRIAKGVANFCWKMYTMNPTGLPFDSVSINNYHIDSPPDNHRYWIMRPEAVETWFILYRLTNDTKYQEWGWRFFESIEKYSKVNFGYSGIRNPSSTNPQHDDVQRSYFLAETLKYLYLLFTPSDYIPLDKYVFNTEAHPLSKYDISW